MGILNKPYTFSPNTTASSSEVNSNFDTIYNEFNGSIGAANLATDAVTTAKIADSNVTTAKIADLNVTTAKLANASVTSSKLSTGATSATVATLQTTASATYVDLATVGPSVTVTIGSNGLALVILSLFGANDTGGQTTISSVDISGANTQTPAAFEAIGTWSNNQDTASRAKEFSYSRLLTGLTPGSTTFKMQYRVTANTGTFARRVLTVIPL